MLSILFGQQNETKGGWGGLRWCVDAAEQWHIGVHVWADTADGAAARHARPDEDQEEELTHGKCLVPHLLPGHTQVSRKSAVYQIMNSRKHSWITGVPFGV